MTLSITPTPEDELLSTTAKTILQNLLDDTTARKLTTASIHSYGALEKDGDDSDGKIDGITWRQPTVFPSAAPTTLEPTSSPTYYPTPRAEPKVLKGVFWYDRNANGVRDSNVKVDGIGNDVEYSHGVGGVRVSLVECDENTGRAVIGTTSTGGTTMSEGVDVHGRPQVVPLGDVNGKYGIHLEQVATYYLVQVVAPEGFLFTSGVCSDAVPPVPGWKCDYSLAVDATAGYHRGLQATASQSSASGGDGLALGIKSGRSKSCVYVDRFGAVQAPINFGIMKEGDNQNLETNVALVLDFDEAAAKATPGRRLAEVLRRATVIDEHDDGATVTTRYLLGDDDKAAIGTVTAEVLASTLDGRLAANGVALDSVDPKDVILSNSRPSKDNASGAASSTAAAAATTNQLAVAMEIKGHYSPPPDLDFDYIVQDSINRDTGVIRRGLREYNSNCRAQTSKVNNQGLKESDFDSVVSSSGAAKPGRGGSTNGGDVASMKNVFSTACQSDFLVPDYFETSLNEIDVRRVSDVKFRERDEIVFVAEEARSGIDSWAMGPIAAIAGLIILLMGAFVFRRALGPRRADKYSDGRKTKDVDKSEMRRFGEAGGDMDDGSVDSAFYSESDDDSDLEETEKERKMRRKRKEKGNDQNRSERAAAKKKSGKSGRQNSRSSRNVNNKLALSRGSDDTESLGKSSNSSDELIEKSRERKRAAKQRSTKRSSSTRSLRKSSSTAVSERSLRKSSSTAVSDRSDRKSSRRGRSKRSGGDNARIV